MYSGLAGFFVIDDDQADSLRSQNLRSGRVEPWCSPTVRSSGSTEPSDPAVRAVCERSSARSISERSHDASTSCGPRPCLRRKAPSATPACRERQRQDCRASAQLLHSCFLASTTNVVRRKEVRNGNRYERATTPNTRLSPCPAPHRCDVPVLGPASPSSCSAESRRGATVVSARSVGKSSRATKCLFIDARPPRKTARPASSRAKCQSSQWRRERWSSKAKTGVFALEEKDIRQIKEGLRLARHQDARSRGAVIGAAAGFGIYDSGDLPELRSAGLRGQRLRHGLRGGSWAPPRCTRRLRCR